MRYTFFHPKGWFCRVYRLVLLFRCVDMPLRKKIALEPYHNVENLLNIEIIEAIDMALCSIGEPKAYFYTKGNCLCYRVLDTDYVVVNQTLESWIDSNVMHQVFSFKFEHAFECTATLQAANSKFEIAGFHTLALTDKDTGIYIFTVDASMGLLGYEVQKAFNQFFAFARSLKSPASITLNSIGVKSND